MSQGSKHQEMDYKNHQMKSLFGLLAMAAVGMPTFLSRTVKKVEMCLKAFQ
jgi:hypothetical protein